MIFDSKQCEVINERTNNVILTGLRTKDNVYIIDESNPMESRCLMTKIQESQLWHRRMGHVNYRLLKMLSSQGIVKGIPNINEEQPEICKACQMRKQVRSSFKGLKEITSTRPLQLIYMDLVGPNLSKV